MEDNATDENDIDFSIISPGNDKPKDIDFSVNQLLDNPKKQSNKSQSASLHQQSQCQIQPQGSFMRDLGKLQQEISYDTNPYDIYETSEQPNQYTGTGEGKQQDTCTKTINNMTKLCQKFTQNDFKHLILDFNQQKGNSNLKSKDKFQDYLQGSILQTKKIAIKVHEKLKQPRAKSQNQQKFRSSSSKNKKLRNIKIINNINRKDNLVTSRSSKNQKNLITKSSSKASLDSQKSKNRCSSKSKQKKQGFIFLNNNKVKNKLRSEVYSEYFGFEGPKTQIRKNKQKCNSKGKQIIFSKKNVNLCH